MLWLKLFCDWKIVTKLKKKFLTKPLKKKCDQTLKKIVTKLKKKHFKKREKLPWEFVGCQGVEVIKKLWQNSKTQIVKKKNLKTLNVTKLKNSNFDKTQKLKLRPKTKILNVTKFKNSNCDKTKKENCDKTQNSNCDKTQKHKFWQNLKTQIVIKLKNPNCDKT